MLVYLRTSNILILVLSTIDELISKLVISKAIREYKEVYRKYPISAKNRCGERSSMQQFTHPVHPKARCSYLLRQFSPTKREKYDRQGRQKIQRAEKQATTNKTEYKGKKLYFQKINCIAKACPYQIACVARLPKLSSLAAAASP